MATNILLLTAAVVTLCLPIVNALDGCTQSQEQEPFDHRSGKQRTFSIAGWNVDWFFSSDHTSFVGPDITPEEAEAKIAGVADVMNQQDVDMWVLAEVEDCDILNRTLFANESALYNKGYRRYLIPGGDTFTRQQMGLISRIAPQTKLKRTEERFPYPDKRSECGYNVETGLKTTTVTKNFYTIVNIPPFGEVLVVGVHFRAYPNDPRPCAQREAQAKVVSQVVKQKSHLEEEDYTGIGEAEGCSADSQGRDFPYHLLNITWTREAIVIGDFNDLDARIPDISSNSPNSRTLEIMRETGLRSVARIANKSNRWTWGAEDATDPRRSMIDHIFVSPGLYEKLESVDIEWTQQITKLSDHTRVIAHFNYDMISRDLESGETPKSFEKCSKDLQRFNWTLNDFLGFPWTLAGNEKAEVCTEAQSDSKLEQLCDECRSSENSLGDNSAKDVSLSPVAATSIILVIVAITAVVTFLVVRQWRKRRVMRGGRRDSSEQIHPGSNPINQYEHN